MSQHLQDFLRALTYRRDHPVNDGPKDLHPRRHGLVIDQLERQRVLGNRATIHSHPPVHTSQHFISQGENTQNR